MSSGFDEYWDRKIRGEGIPPEFGGPVKGVTGKKYEQLEFDFSEPENEDILKIGGNPNDTYQRDVWKLKNDVGNCVMQANAIIKVVMDSMGSSGGSSNDDYEFALWGASELLQNAADLLE